MSELVTVVDEQNQVVGSFDRAEVRREGLRHRATYVVVRRTTGSILVQKRSPDKDAFPNLEDPTTGGVVRSGETYEGNAKRELVEELGIEHAMPEVLFDFYFEYGTYRVWGRAFSVVFDGPVELRDGEVVSYRFMEPKELIELFDTGKLIPDGEYVAKRLLGKR